MIDIKGKTALVTGSSRGIGQQIAIGLARLGCHVVVHGRLPESTATTLHLLKAYPVKTYSVYGDLADKQQLNALIDQVRRLQVPVDILYNNAGVMPAYHHDIWSFGWDEWMQTMQVNVMALYDLCGAFIPAMIERKFGRVVNLSSGIRHEPGLAPYGASKHAVNKLTDDIASSLEGTGVRINTLDPDWLRTDLGGPNAPHAVEEVLPGALAPVLIDDDGPNGIQFKAIGS